MSKSGIGSLLKRYKDRGTLNRNVESGRNRVTMATDDRMMKRHALRNRKQSPRRMATLFCTSKDTQISRPTFTHRLKEESVRSHKCRRKPLLSHVNVTKRSAGRRSTNLRQFRPETIWSDESTFSLISDRQKELLRAV